MSNLFTAVSAEQQEIVAGGFNFAAFNTAFIGSQNAQAGRATSGFGGSVAVGAQESVNVNTAARTTLINNPDPSLIILPGVLSANA